MDAKQGACVCCQTLTEQRVWQDEDPDGVEGVSSMPVCEACYDSGRFEAWVVNGLKEIRESLVGFESSGNLAKDLETLRSYKKHNSRIEDGVCPNGCALMIIDGNVHTCPSCHFQLVKSNLNIK